MTARWRHAQGRVPVIPGSFYYHRPTSVQEAIGLLAKLGDDGRLLAGGHSLIPTMKLRLATPANLIDLGGIADLKGIRTDGNDIVIGAMTTQHELIVSDLLAGKIPILREPSTRRVKAANARSRRADSTRAFMPRRCKPAKC
jgi:CO/xanthine dehydrogenase FAD-binding subunit